MGVERDKGHMHACMHSSLYRVVTFQINSPEHCINIYTEFTNGGNQLVFKQR